MAENQIYPTGDEDVLAFTTTAGQRISAPLVQVSVPGTLDLTLVRLN